MPTATSTVGPLDMPLPAGATESAVDDPTLSGLARYLAFWLNLDLNTKLANLPGTSSTAVPVDNVFLWDPGKYFVRGRGDGASSPIPALYLWRMGRSQYARYSTVYDMRLSTIGLLWAFDELVLPGSFEDRYGLVGAADASLFRAVQLGYHPSYTPVGGRAGTHIAVALSLCAHGVLYDGGEQGLLSPIPEATEARGVGGDGPVLRAYPSLRGTFRVWERVNGYLPLATDAAPELAVTMGVTDGDPSAPLPFFQRYLPGPDAVSDDE